MLKTFYNQEKKRSVNVRKKKKLEFCDICDFTMNSLGHWMKKMQSYIKNNNKIK